NNNLPAPAIFTKDGKPLLSWRVAILPYIEEDTLYQEFKLDEPWDSEHNKKLIARMPKMYQSANAKLNAEYKTVFLGPVMSKDFGPGGSIFAPHLRKGLSLAQVAAADGAPYTIALVRANDDAAAAWTKPEDLVIDPKEPLRGIIRPRSEPIVVGMA